MQNPIAVQLSDRQRLKQQYRHDLLVSNQLSDLLNDRLSLLRQKYQDAQDVCLSAYAVENIKQEIKLLNELIRFYKK